MKRFLSLPIDWFLLTIPLILSVTGVITIYTITFNEYQVSLAVNQAVYTVLGVITMLVLMFTDYRSLGAVATLLFVIGLLVLVPLLPPIAPHLPFTAKIFGAYRWYDFRVFQFQPAEIFKLVAALFASRFLANHVGALPWQRTVIYLLAALIAVGLILFQPDLGTAAVVFSVMSAAFLAARPSRLVILTVLIALVVAVPILWDNLQPYQRTRIETFLNPAADPQGQGYNVRQSIIAIGSGGLTGRGFGEGSQTVLNFLPVPHADFIFAGFAEATGFVGASILVILYVVVLLRAISIARESKDSFGQLLAVALGTKFFFQIAVHIGMNLGLLPVTGIPLPFMSYGGTALVVDFAVLGILQSIYIRQTRPRFGR